MFTTVPIHYENKRLLGKEPSRTLFVGRYNTLRIFGEFGDSLVDTADKVSTVAQLSLNLSVVVRSVVYGAT